MQENAWSIWIDTGGTFTDCIATTPPGGVKRLKVLSSSLLRVKVLTGKKRLLQISLPFTPTANNEQRRVTDFDVKTSTVTLDQPFTGDCPSTVEMTTDEEVPVFAARILTETAIDQTFPRIEMKLGSTRGTNALLERKGAMTVLVVTKGFKDLLLIGNQQRDNLFTLNIKKRSPLYAAVIEVEERILADGTILKPLDKRILRNFMDGLKRLRAHHSRLSGPHLAIVGKRDHQSDVQCRGTS